MQVLRYTLPLCHFWFVYVWNIATAKCLSLTSGGQGGGGVVVVLPPLFYQGKTRPQKRANGTKSNCPKFAFFCFSFWIKETFKGNFTKSLHARFLIQRPFCIIRRKLVSRSFFLKWLAPPQEFHAIVFQPPLQNKQTNKQTNERTNERTSEKKKSFTLFLTSSSQICTFLSLLHIIQYFPPT